MSAPAHPAPSAMAATALPDDPRLSLVVHARTHYAAGIAAERARVAAWLRTEAKADPDTAPQLERIADELEGKDAARPR